MKRRALLSSTALVGIAFLNAGCQPAPPGGSPATTATTAAQALAWAAGAQTLLEGGNGAAGLLQVLAPLAPTVLTPDVLAITKSDFAVADGVLAGLSASSPPATVATGLQTVEGYLNTAMALVGEISSDVPGLAQYAAEIDAVTVAIQLIETFVNVQIVAQGGVPPAGVPIATPPAPGGASTARGARVTGLQNRIITMRVTAHARGMTTDRAAQVLGVKL